MLTVDEAFRKFKSRLELNEKERKNASKRHNEVRDYLSTKFKIDTSFLTGSYARHTMTKPLKDVDIFFVFSGEEEDYHDKAPHVIIDDIYDVLVEKYGDAAVDKQNRSVGVDFGVVVDEEDNTNYRVVSIDVVPSFAVGNNYEIPDLVTDTWIKTNPKIHADKAVAAHQAYSSEWKGLIRMLKYWNEKDEYDQKVVKPSFLVEVMALDCLYGNWGGRFDYEMQSFFSTLADRIHAEWPDPAGLGSPVSDGMDIARKNRAKRMLLEAADQATDAIHLTRQGKNGEALKAWRNLFGPKFPLS